MFTRAVPYYVLNVWKGLREQMTEDENKYIELKKIIYQAKIKKAQESISNKFIKPIKTSNTETEEE